MNDVYHKEAEWVAKKNGFRDAEEMREIVLKIKIDNAGDMVDFEHWRKYDGTKEGALKLINDKV